MGNFRCVSNKHYLSCNQFLQFFSLFIPLIIWNILQVEQNFPRRYSGGSIFCQKRCCRRKSRQINPQVVKMIQRHRNIPDNELSFFQLWFHPFVHSQCFYGKRPDVALLNLFRKKTDPRHLIANQSVVSITAFSCDLESFCWIVDTLEIPVSVKFKLCHNNSIPC